MLMDSIGNRAQVLAIFRRRSDFVIIFGWRFINFSVKMWRHLMGKATLSLLSTLSKWDGGGVTRWPNDLSTSLRRVWGSESCMWGQRAKKITSDQKQEIKLVKEKSYKLKLQRNMIFLCHIPLCPFIRQGEMSLAFLLLSLYTITI